MHLPPWWRTGRGIGDATRERLAIERRKAGVFRVQSIDVILVFHLAHCASECAAPALWAKLK